MPQSELKLIKRSLEYHPKDEVEAMPPRMRGIYALYKRRGTAHDRSHHYDLIYIGMTTYSIRGRLRKHRNSRSKQWTHFSIFEVWENISDTEIAELEGLFRHLYRYDTKANKNNHQKAYAKLRRLTDACEAEWNKDDL